jgi:acetylglutamate kinase
MRVLKVGGRPQSDARLIPAIIQAWNDAPGELVLVHGGGDELSTLMREMGREPTFVGGRRVTDPADLDLVRMVLSGLANKRLVSGLARVGAVGISGEDAGLLVATLADGGAMGRVGTPASADVRILRTLLAAGHLPVVSPVARAAEDGGAYNVNGDDAAAALAVALGAEELVLVSDVPAVLADGRPVLHLDATAARTLIDTGVASGGMAAKLEAALLCLSRGVPRVRVGDITTIASPTAGTVLSASPVPAQ